MYWIGVWTVPVKTGGRKQEAILKPATAADMPDNWTFSWREFWSQTNFEYQKIIKLSLQGQVLGLIRYAVYSDDEETSGGGVPYLLEVLHLECMPKSIRLAEPVGRWLLWYAAKTGLKFCTPKENDPLISLDSVEDAIPYYSNPK